MIETHDEKYKVMNYKAQLVTKHPRQAAILFSGKLWSLIGWRRGSNHFIISLTGDYLFENYTRFQFKNPCRSVFIWGKETQKYLNLEWRSHVPFTRTFASISAHDKRDNI